MQARSTILRSTGAAVLALLLVLIAFNLGLGNKRVDAEPRHAYSTAGPLFLHSMAGALGQLMTTGNEVQELLNGEQVFPAMLQAIRAAKHTVSLETYIYWSGTIGKEFSVALAERARAGIMVHVLLDWVGGDLDEGALLEMRRSGVQIRFYNPPKWFNLDRLNNRTHRKLLVVDGRTGFTGGVGIADVWRGNAQGPDRWRDSHFQVRGPAVSQMQAAFMKNWAQTTGEVLHGEAYFPEPGSSGTSLAQVFTSAPGAESMQMMYLLSIAAAEKSIDLSAAYFVPDDVAISTLVSALQRGVRVRIIVPGESMDVPPVRWASRHRWGELLRAGASIYEYQETMYHCKVLVVDGVWVSVGSTNFDNRSLSINDEANMNVYDAEFADRQVSVFQNDLARSRVVTFDQWRSRPLAQKLLDWLASVLGSQL